MNKQIEETVKLNDPHQGTETFYGELDTNKRNLMYVKLNDPHQGTETN